MTNKPLADWIKSEEAQGYSEKQLRDFLLKKGYSQKEIDGAISQSGRRAASIPVKDIFKPSLLRCTIPALVFILVLVSFFINSAYLPKLGQDFCDRFHDLRGLMNLGESIREKASETNADPEELIRLIKEENALRDQLNSHSLSYEDFKPILAGNIYLLASKVYLFNPFFPTPCEELIMKELFTNKRHCRYYISEENHACVQESIFVPEKADSPSLGTALFSDGLPPYKKISLGLVLIHGIILFAALYLVICLISFGRDWLAAQTSKVKLTINGAIVTLVVIAFFLFNSAYLLFLPILVFVFIMSSLIKDDKHNRLFLLIMVAILILLMIAGVFIINSLIDRNLSHTVPSGVESKVEYEAILCESTKVLSTEEKMGFNLDQRYIDEEWNVCFNPSCQELCVARCPKSSYAQSFNMLRGDNPSCICRC